ncbi:hypothetical protein ICC15_14620 [Piscirickettsia salmonis]|nr:hypothetical protein ICC15_14620 [Piscirickettsia salmonis]
MSVQPFVVAVIEYGSQIAKRLIAPLSPNACASWHLDETLKLKGAGITFIERLINMANTLDWMLSFV